MTCSGYQAFPVSREEISRSGAGGGAEGGDGGADAALAGEENWSGVLIAGHGHSCAVRSAIPRVLRPFRHRNRVKNVDHRLLICQLSSMEIGVAWPEAPAVMTGSRPVPRLPRYGCIGVPAGVGLVLLTIAGTKTAAGHEGFNVLAPLWLLGGMGVALAVMLLSIALIAPGPPRSDFAADENGVWLGFGNGRRLACIHLPWGDIDAIRTEMLWPDAGPGIPYLCFEAREVDPVPALAAIPATRVAYRQFGTPLALALPRLDLPAASVLEALRGLAPARITISDRLGVAAPET
jgi:hypothetical protein